MTAEQTCRLCGCTQHDACYDDDRGACGWVKPDLCTHCADSIAICGTLIDTIRIDIDRGNALAEDTLVELRPHHLEQLLKIINHRSDDREVEAKMAEALREADELLSPVERPSSPDPQHYEAVKSLGRRIGYGALMTSASAAWREHLAEGGYPAGGEFVVGPCQASLDRTLALIRAARLDK